MSVAKIIELTSTAATIEEAIRQGVAKASETVRNIQHVYVDGIEAYCDGSAVSSFHVHLKITFIVD